MDSSVHCGHLMVAAIAWVRSDRFFFGDRDAPTARATTSTTASST